MYQLALNQEELEYLREFLAEEAEWIGSAQHEGYGDLVKGLYKKVKELPRPEETTL